MEFNNQPNDIINDINLLAYFIDKSLIHIENINSTSRCINI